jgi:LytS/YehU family sensor histidine kinase
VINTDDSVDQEEIMIPFMILQPFVENAIQHGLVHLAGEKKFSVLLENIDDTFLRCTIEDNGIGRQKANAIRDAKLIAGRYQSKGIDIVRQRLDLLHQRTGKKGDILYEDLYNVQGDPCGTRVILYIPYYQNQEL